jgi:para-nitrobenzyl esterase
VPGEKLLDVYKKARASGFRGTFAPVVNGIDMPRDPFSPDASPVSRDVTLMIGTTSDEGSLYFWLEGSGADHVFSITWEELPAEVTKYTAAKEVAPTIAAFRKLYPKASPYDVLVRILSQFIMRINSVMLADRKAMQGGAPVYSYLMTWPTPVNGGRYGATHVVDVPLEFDNVANAVSLLGTPEENNIQPLADRMSAAWAQFARTGNPNIPSLPNWPEYNEKTRETMILDRDCKVVSDPGAAERAAMEGIPVRAMAG